MLPWPGDFTSLSLSFLIDEWGHVQHLPRVVVRIGEGAHKVHNAVLAGGHSVPVTIIITVIVPSSRLLCTSGAGSM